MPRQAATLLAAIGAAVVLVACGGSSSTSESPSTSASQASTGKRGATEGIQNFGEEGSEPELRQAAEAVHGFYVARAEENWRQACLYLAALMAQKLDELASRSPQLRGEGCPDLVKALTRPLPRAAERETTLVDAGSLRREGERGFLIYRGAEGKTYAIPMHLDSEGWLVAALAGTPLS